MLIIKFSFFYTATFNVFNNYIRHETEISDDKDPPCIKSRIKSLIERKDKLCKTYRRFKSNSHLLIKLSLLQEQLHVLINKSKQNYYARMAGKLTNVQRNSKPTASFWYLYCSLWTYFTSCSSVSIVNFEHVIAGWAMSTWFIHSSS